MVVTIVGYVTNRDDASTVFSNLVSFAAQCKHFFTFKFIFLLINLCCNLIA